MIEYNQDKITYDNIEWITFTVVYSLKSIVHAVDFDMNSFKFFKSDKFFPPKRSDYSCNKTVCHNNEKSMGMK